MRPDIMIGRDPAFRKSMKKSKKKGPRSEETTDGKPRPLNTVAVTFREDSEGIHAMVDGRRVPLSGYSDKVVSEGQSWKCMIDRTDPYRPGIIPLDLISEKPEAEEVPAETPKVGKKVEIPEVPVHSAETRRLEEENEKLRNENAELRRRIRVFEEYSAKCEEKDRTIRTQKRTIDSLSTQVNVLNNKASDMNIGKLEFRIEELEDGIESREREIVVLREKLRSMGADDLKFVPRLPSVMKAIKNGSTLRFKDSVEDGRYNVYVNPRSHRLMIVPDANGAACCKEGEMHLPCIDLPSIGGETGPRKVVIDAVGDGWEVILA